METLKSAIASVKEAFSSDSVIITKIMQGRGGFVRIDARTRYHVSGMNNFFSKWVSEEYANRLAIENYGKKISEFNCYQY